MNVMIDCSHYGPWICKLMSGVWIFIPRALEAVQFVIEVAIIDVEFVRVDTNDGTCIWRISLHDLHEPPEYVMHMIQNQIWDSFV